MKKLLLSSLVFLATLLFTSTPGRTEEQPRYFSPAPKVTYTYSAEFNYFSHNESWWTGLAIRNRNDTKLSLRITVFDTEGDDQADGDFEVDARKQMVYLLDSEEFIENGTVPPRGSILIEGTADFVVVKFTGNNVKGGFSEMEKDAEPIPPE